MYSHHPHRNVSVMVPIEAAKNNFRGHGGKLIYKAVSDGGIFLPPIEFIEVLSFTTFHISTPTESCSIHNRIVCIDGRELRTSYLQFHISQKSTE